MPNAGTDRTVSDGRLIDSPHSRGGRSLDAQVRLADASSGPLAEPPLQVLVVEDDAALRELVSFALLEEGYQVISAANGADALERVRRYHPEVILLDVQMPVMDGPTFAERYHALPGPHAPIIVFTAAGNAHRWSRRIRAAAYVDKSVDLWALAGLIRRCAAASSS